MGAARCLRAREFSLTQTVLEIAFTGSVYALFAFGYALTYGVTGSFNIAHAAVFMAGAWAAAYLLQAGHPMWLAFLVALAAGGAAGVVIDRVALWPARVRGAGSLGANGPIVASFAALALFSAIFAGRASDVWATLHRGAGRLWPSHAFPHTDEPQWVAAALCALATLLGFALLRATRLGAALRAVANNQSAARAAGIDVEWIFVQAAFVAAAFGALAGIAYFAVGGSAAAASASQIQLSVLVAVVLGGLGSVLGSIVAAYAVAAVQIGVLLLYPGVNGDATAFATLIVALAFFPRGLFPSRALRPA